MERYHKIIAGGAAVVISVILYALTFTVKDLVRMSVGPGFVPRIVAALLLGLGVLLIVQGFQQLRHPVEVGEPGGDRNPHRVLKSFFLLVLYVALLRYVGFIIMTVLYLFFQISLLAPEGHRKPVLFGVVALVTSVTSYYLFVQFFRVILPSGILG